MVIHLEMRPRAMPWAILWLPLRGGGSEHRNTRTHEAADQRVCDALGYIVTATWRRRSGRRNSRTHETADQLVCAVRSGGPR